MGVVHSFVQIMLNILFVVGLQIRSLSLLLSPIISSLLSAAFLMVNNRFYAYIKPRFFDRKNLKQLLKFSLPTVPETLIWWFLTGFAKMYLSAVHGEETLGIYAVANKFSDLLIMLYSIFNMAWAEFAYAAYKEENRDTIYSVAYNNIARAMLSAVLILLPLTKICISWFLNESYLSGAAYMPVLYLMAYINILSTYYGSGFQSAKKTNGVFYSSLLGVATNVPLCLLLVPKFGVWGVVASLFTANIVLLVAKKVMSRRFFHVSVDYKLFVLLIPVGLCMAAFYLGGTIINVICLVGTLVIALLSNRQLIQTILSSIFKRRRSK